MVSTSTLRRQLSTVRGVAVPFLFAIATAAGCASPGWTVYAYNNSDASVLVRFTSDTGVTVQPLAPQQMGFVFDGASRPEHLTLEFLDPDTCDPLASLATLPRQHPQVVFSDDDHVGVSVDDPGDQDRVLLSVTTECLPAT